MNWWYSYFKSNPITVVDAGARGSLEWAKKIAFITNMYAFDPDPQAISELGAKYKSHSFNKLKLFQEALGTINNCILYKTSKPSMSSLHLPEPENYDLQYSLYGQKHDWQNALKITEEIKVNCIGIDDLITRENIPSIDLLKLDTQGSELDILQSAVETIKTGGIKVIIAEVSMFPVYKNQTLFSDLDIWLKDRDYIMADYRVYPPEQWDKNRTVPGISLKHERKVYAMNGDAVYFLNADKGSNYTTKESIEKVSLIMAMLGYTSIA